MQIRKTTWNFYAVDRLGQLSTKLPGGVVPIQSSVFQLSSLQIMGALPAHSDLHKAFSYFIKIWKRTEIIQVQYDGFFDYVGLTGLQSHLFSQTLI